jgi:hypothetical protein
MKANTRVHILGTDWNGNETTEAGTVLRWHKISGNREDLPGYHRVRFDYDTGYGDGIMLVHESRMRVMDQTA